MLICTFACWCGSKYIGPITWRLAKHTAIVPNTPKASDQPGARKCVQWPPIVNFFGRPMSCSYYLQTVFSFDTIENIAKVYSYVLILSPVYYFATDLSRCSSNRSDVHKDQQFVLIYALSCLNPFNYLLFETQISKWSHLGWMQLKAKGLSKLWQLI